MALGFKIEVTDIPLAEMPETMREAIQVRLHYGGQLLKTQKKEVIYDDGSKITSHQVYLMQGNTYSVMVKHDGDYICKNDVIIADICEFIKMGDSFLRSCVMETLNEIKEAESK